MSVKLEISGNYFKITNGANNPSRFPFRDIRFYANDSLEYIEFFNNQLNGRLSSRISYSDEPAEGSVTIDTIGATHSTGTITLIDSVANAFATNTVQCISVLAGHTTTIDGNSYIAVDGAKANNTEFDMSGTDDECAADLKDSIDNDTRPGLLGNISTSIITNTITLTTDVLGIAGNTVALAQTGDTIVIGNATFENGVDADTVLVDELVYTAVDGAKSNDTEYDISGTNDQAATDLADSIDDDVRIGTEEDNVTSTATTNVVTVVSEIGGTVGNATLLSSSSGTRLAVSAANLAGGLNDASVSGILIDAVEIMSAAEFSGDDKNALAILVAVNITAHTSNPDYNAVAVADKINITAADDDTNVNGFVVASTVVKATSTDANMTGAIADIVDSNGDPFETWAALITFLEKNTGGELIA